MDGAHIAVCTTVWPVLQNLLPYHTAADHHNMLFQNFQAQDNLVFVSAVPLYWNTKHDGMRRCHAISPDYPALPS